jgi:hydrogenase maturation protease
MTKEATPRSGPLIVGLGSPDQGDDGVGLEVARAVEALALPGVHTAIHEDPTALLHLWEGFDAVVVIDAVMTGRPPGAITVIEVGAGKAQLPPESWAATGRGGTHAFGLATAVELARVLGQLPKRLTVVGIEAASFAQGTTLSPEVAASVDDAVAIVGAVARVRARSASPGVSTGLGAGALA